MADDDSLESTFHQYEVKEEMRGRAFRICLDYLHGSWKKIEAEDMIIKHISGGLSNHLYYCALPASTPTVANEPSEVLVRFYGQVHGEEALESLLAESVIFTLLSERRLGPTLYGVFPGGRIEQYIPARSMTTQELAVPEYSRLIASKMARIHALNVPISKEPTWIWRSMERWLKTSEDLFRSFNPSSVSAASVTATSAEALERLRAFPYREEMNYLRRLVAGIQSPVVFAHNDMQEGNILINKNATKVLAKISLIDFEYCSYNYRGFDLANHFCEWVYNYKGPTEPFFTADSKAFPRKDQQLNFIRAYLGTYEAVSGRKPLSSMSLIAGGHSAPNHYAGKLFSVSLPFPSSSAQTMHQAGSCSSAGSVEQEDPPTKPHPAEEVLLQEVQVFVLASHLFWTLWSIVQGHVSKIPFGYLDYALVRMEHYYDFKNSLSTTDTMKRKSDKISTKDN